MGSGRSATESADALSELVVHVFRLEGVLRAVGDAMAAPSGQTTARWRVLAALDHGPLTVAEIARAWWLARQSVQRLADSLAAEGLVTYEPNPAHRRAKLVALTPLGRTALTEIRAAQRVWADEVGAHIRGSDLRTANRILAQVLDVLEPDG
jgi:DNA-binding MarR family transcriptional regulator